VEKLLIELHHFKGNSPPSPDNASNNKGLFLFFQFFTFLAPVIIKRR